MTSARKKLAEAIRFAGHGFSHEQVKVVADALTTSERERARFTEAATPSCLKVKGSDRVIRMGAPLSAIVTICERILDTENWKNGTACPFFTSDYMLALDVESALAFYCGGAERHEITLKGPGGMLVRLHKVTSKGYYHYTGA
jgi:hypothetical protein